MQTAPCSRRIGKDATDATRWRRRTHGEPADRSSWARQVTASGRHLGSVVIEGNLSLLYAWMRIQAFVILGALLGGTLVALSLTRLLQRAISSPMLDLAATADRVSTRRDYFDPGEADDRR